MNIWQCSDVSDMPAYSCRNQDPKFVYYLSGE